MRKRLGGWLRLGGFKALALNEEVFGWVVSEKVGVFGSVVSRL